MRPGFLICYGHLQYGPALKALRHLVQVNQLRILFRPPAHPCIDHIIGMITVEGQLIPRNILHFIMLNLGKEAYAVPVAFYRIYRIIVIRLRPDYFIKRFIVLGCHSGCHQYHGDKKQKSFHINLFFNY